MDKIIVINEFLNSEEIHNILTLIEKNKWKFNDNNWYCELINEKYLSENILNIIEKSFLKKFKIIENYATGRTYGQDDLTYNCKDISNTTNKYILNIFLSEIPPEYIEAACGYMYFKFPEIKYKICYEPLFGMGILFPYNYEHKEKSYNRYITELKITLSFILEEI